MRKLTVIFEFLEFIKENKKWWLFPIFFLLVIFSTLIILAEGSVLAPFIYAVF